MDDIEYSWGFAEHEEKDELRQKLVYTTQELEKLKLERIEEIKKNNDYVNKLIIMLKCALQQRDEARNQLQQLINKISFHTNSTALESTVATQPMLVHQDFDVPSNAFDPIIESLNWGRVLPRRGMFLQAVLQAGPLLQTLLAAVPLPRWRNPPQLQGFQVPSEVLGSNVEQLVGRENSSLSYANFNCVNI